MGHWVRGGGGQDLNLRNLSNHFKNNEKICSNNGNNYTFTNKT